MKSRQKAAPREVWVAFMDGRVITAAEERSALTRAGYPDSEKFRYILPPHRLADRERRHRRTSRL